MYICAWQHLALRERETVLVEAGGQQCNEILIANFHVYRVCLPQAFASFNMHYVDTDFHS